MKVYVQIGANIGNDSFQNLIMLVNEKTMVLLVEPNYELLDQLSNNYEELKNRHDIIIVPYAIATTNGDTNLYLYQESGHSTLINRKTRPPKNGSFKKIQVMTFNDLCEKFNLNTIEYLSIDTEGLDYEILNSIDLSKINIKTIVFEKWIVEDDDLNKNYRTGTIFLNNFVVPKFKNYKWEDVVLDAIPSYKLTKIVDE
jgi:FkbM family methyltransferase